MSALALGVVALAGSACSVVLLLRFAHRMPADTPNPRSLHARPLPRGGGLALWAGFLPAALLAPPDVPGSWGAWLLAAGAVAAVSLADDVRGVPAGVRLVVQLAAALVVMVATMQGSALPWPVVIAGVLVVVWGANLYNFMDGSDGLAALMAVTGFGAYAAGAAIAGAPWVGLAAVALASVPFLAVNVPPARMFMGDVGAVPLGFLAAAFGIGGVVQGWWPGWFPLLVFLPFIADATLTLARRALNRERVWEAHRSHFYQRLNASGAGHRGTLAIYGAVMLACAAIAVVALRLAPSAGWPLLACAVLLHLIGFMAIDYHQRIMRSRGS